MLDSFMHLSDRTELSSMQACISLNSMYDEARQCGKALPNEGEFRAYHLLLLMGTHGKYKYNSTEYRKALKVR